MNLTGYGTTHLPAPSITFLSFTAANYRLQEHSLQDKHARSNIGTLTPTLVARWVQTPFDSCLHEVKLLLDLMLVCIIQQSGIYDK